MTSKTWNGTNDSYGNAAAWSPSGVPVNGDFALINSGTVNVATTVSGVGFQLNEIAGATASTTLALNGATLDGSTTLAVNNANAFNATAPTISVTGTSTFSGTATFTQNGGGAQINLVIATGSTLVNAGTLNFIATSPQTTGGGTLQNNGTIALVNPNSVAQIPILTDTISGTGQIALGANARIDFAGAVGSGQTVVLNDGTRGNEIVQLDAVGSFKGTITGFSSGDLIAVTNTPYTSFTYTSTGTNSGVLSLLNGSTVQGSLNLTGQFTPSSFTLTFNDFGGGQSNLQIATSAVNTVSAGLPPGYENGGGSGGTVGPVYRFFDKIYGTHFFTSDVGERNTVLTTRSADLVQENNGFGDVSASSTSAVAVYRFFDTKFGTHFFTANAGERDTVINTRSDLKYEVNSTFYEHSSQQSGDVAVYRLFDTKTGTQFLTGDQNEFNGLTNAGSSTYRADLRNEGVAFYAPTGSFT